MPKADRTRTWRRINSVEAERWKAERAQKAANSQAYRQLTDQPAKRKP